MQLLHSTLGLYYGSARPHENCCVKFSVKKLMPQFWAPIGPRAPPRIAGSAGSVVTPLSTNACYLLT